MENQPKKRTVSEPNPKMALAFALVLVLGIITMILKFAGVF